LGIHGLVNFIYSFQLVLEMKYTIQLVMVLAVVLTLSSCKKDNTVKTLPPPIPVTETGPYLYVGGSTFTKGLYWKSSLHENLAHPVPDTVANSSNITALLTSGKEKPTPSLSNT
jgi:hypothetical protein